MESTQRHRFSLHSIAAWPAAAMLGLFYLCLAPVQAQPIDQWHYIDSQSVLHTDLVEGLHGAGVIQTDQIFALLYLGLPGENGVVSVVLPTGRDTTAGLTSTLIKSSGQRFERALTDAELEIDPVNATDQAFSFPITGEDIELFKSASRWELRSGNQSWTVTLRGSRRAIETAETEQARRIADLSDAVSQEPSQ